YEERPDVRLFTDMWRGLRLSGARLCGMTPVRIALAAAAALALAAPTANAQLTFGPPRQLQHGDPNAHPYYSGGEPSIAFDPNGDGHVYVTAPQFIPTAVDHAAGAGPDSD